MSLPALSRLARSTLSGRIYSQVPSAALSWWKLTGARAPLHRNLSDATGTAGRRSSFFVRRNHKLNTAMAIATFSVVGAQVWHISKNRTDRKYVGSEKSALAFTNEAEQQNTQNGQGQEDIAIVAQFNDWMDEYGIQYLDEETRQTRFSIFKSNVELHGYDTYKEYRSALDAQSYDELVRSLRRPKVDWVEAGVVSPIVRGNNAAAAVVGPWLS